MKKFENYSNNLRVLETAYAQDLANEFVVGGVIGKFFIQFEWGWKVLKELLIYEGSAAAQSGSPREIIKEAYKLYPFMEEDVWLSMLSQRNNMAHIYDASAAKRLVQKILESYIPTFQKLRDCILARYGDILDQL